MPRLKLHGGKLMAWAVEHRGLIRRSGEQGTLSVPDAARLRGALEELAGIPPATGRIDLRLVVGYELWEIAWFGPEGPEPRVRLNTVDAVVAVAQWPD